MTESRQSCPSDREQQADKSWSDGGTRRGNHKGEWKCCVWEAVWWGRLWIPVRDTEGSVAIQQTVGRVPRALLLCQSPDASPSHKGHLHHYCCEEFKIPEDREVFQPIRALHFALKQTEKFFLRRPCHALLRGSPGQFPFSLLQRGKFIHVTPPLRMLIELLQGLINLMCQLFF